MRYTSERLTGRKGVTRNYTIHLRSRDDSILLNNVHELQVEVEESTKSYREVERFVTFISKEQVLQIAEDDILYSTYTERLVCR